MLNKLFHLSLLICLFLSRPAIAQEIPDTPIEHNIGIDDPNLYKPKVHKVFPPFKLTGRIIGIKLESVQGVVITDICSGETATTDEHGIYHIAVAKGDSVAFVVKKYSNDFRLIKSSDNLNFVMIKRKTDGLSAKQNITEYTQAKKQDDELYRILEKDAKEEGKWKY